MRRLEATPATPGRAAALLWRTVRRHPLVLVSCVLALVVEALSGLLVPIGIGIAVDVIAGTSAAASLVAAVGMLVAAALATGASAAAAASLTARVTEPAVAELRENALVTVLGTDAGSVELAGTGDVVTRLTSDVERLSEAASGALAAFVSAMLAIGATLVGLATLDWRFAVAGLLAVPIQLGTLRWYLRRSRPVYREARVAESERTQSTIDALRDAAAIRALQLEKRSADEIGAASKRAIGLENAAVRLSTRFFGRLNLAEFIGLAAISVVGFVLVGAGDVTIGAATTAALFFIRLFDPINTVLGLFDTIQQAGASLTRLAGLVPSAAVPESTTAIPGFGASVSGREVSGREVPGWEVSGRDIPGREVSGRGSRDVVGRESHRVGLRVSGLSVCLPGRGEVLHDIEFEVSPGERVAIVGASGAGKTTLARALAGLVEPETGVVEFVDAEGRRLHGVSPMLLEQHTHVFTGTLADDLRLVAPCADDDELLRATSAAGIPLGSGAFAAGLASPVGSGAASAPADAQHIALARLALASPPLAILDEASADAGSVAARRLEEAMERVLASRTSIVIAHRLGQAAASDRVLVMEHGRIVASGPHDRLVAEAPAYARLWDAWRSPQGSAAGSEAEAIGRSHSNPASEGG